MLRITIERPVTPIEHALIQEVTKKRIFAKPLKTLFQVKVQQKEMLCSVIKINVGEQQMTN